MAARSPLHLTSYVIDTLIAACLVGVFARISPVAQGECVCERASNV